ncbi:amidohydrolase family protein [Dyadobacter arcticus]|uniref:TIM-barrel fold metal-dependent hydrolase n=1 Tax=Dyadobacter arcticus TaxID=1078754 RepID=A0ABX0UR13_9BACT|nr:amidohydrolase family protein [Dyadobacter arcticus]NIJ55433.1 putative TIM-barrel fold metal-dependent hydrolase [Dyadobacter arcticus]
MKQDYEPHRSVKTWFYRTHTFVKTSEVVRRVIRQIPTDLDFYRERMDALDATLAENRILYGSDWPNSDQCLPLQMD